MNRYEILNAITTKIKTSKEKLSFKIFRPEITVKILGKNLDLRVKFLTNRYVFCKTEDNSEKKIPYHLLTDTQLELLYYAYRKL